MLKDSQSLPRCIEQGKETEYFFFKMYKKLFFTAVKWSIFESFFYQVIFIVHQLALFLWCDRSLYGKAGSIFAFSYIVITLLLGGIEGSLIPFFEQFSQTKKSFSLFIKKIIMRQMVLICFFVFLGTFASFFFLKTNFSLSLLLLISFFIIIESFKKLVKHLLYLAFYNKYIAALEILQLIFYVTTLWIVYFFKQTFSLSLFFIPFIVFSVISFLFYARLLLDYYQTLSDDFNHCNQHISMTYFFKLRVTIFINQICRLFFSGNCLVTFSSLFSNYAQAGMVTFIHYLTNTITFFLYKVSIPTTEAFLSKIHYFSKTAQYHVLKIVLSLFAFLTIVLGIFLFFNIYYIAPLCGHIVPTKTDLFIFLFFIHLLETLFVIYEKFFITQKKIMVLMLGNIITSALCFLILQKTSSFTAIIIGCFFIRFLFFIALSAFIALSKTAPDGAIKRRE